jgi:CspA family cold shock protein
MEGTVKWFNDMKGYGFIQGDDGKDYFVHETSVERGYLYDNLPVVFNPVKGTKGPKAEKVAPK